jgi:4'-phosphopantetheinyl transferase
MNTFWNEPRGREMPIGPDELHIWLVELRSGSASLQALSGYERARAMRFLSEAARQRYISSHLAMRDILSRYLQTPPAKIAIVQSELQKPHLATNAGARTVSFGLSRSEDMCLVAVASRVRVGVDIESLMPERYEARIEDQVFTIDELAAFATIAPADRWRVFLRGWTRKEAYAKCIGLGLAADLAHTELGMTEETVQVQGIAVSSFIPHEGFLGAWAAEGTLRPSFWSWTV